MAPTPHSPPWAPAQDRADAKADFPNPAPARSQAYLVRPELRPSAFLLQAGPAPPGTDIFPGPAEHVPGAGGLGFATGLEGLGGERPPTLELDFVYREAPGWRSGGRPISGRPGLPLVVSAHSLTLGLSGAASWGNV